MSDESHLRVTTILTRNDLIAFGWHYAVRMRLAVIICVLGFCAFFLTSLVSTPPSSRNVAQIIALLIWSAAPYLVLWFLFAVFTAILTSRYASSRPGQFGELTYEILDEGFRETTPMQVVFTKWAGLPGVMRTKQHIIVKLARTLANVIPVRSFASSEQADAFYAELQRRVAAAKTPAASP